MERFTDLDGNRLERRNRLALGENEILEWTEKCVLPFQQPLFSFPESKFMCPVLTRPSWHGKCVGILIYSLVWDVWMILISPGHVSEPRLDPPRNVRPGLDQSDINQVWDLTVLTFPRTQDFIQHLLLVMLHRAINTIRWDINKRLMQVIFYWLKF